MPYIVFGYEPHRDMNVFKAGVATQLWLNEGDFDAVDEDKYSTKSYKNMNTDQLASVLAMRQLNLSFQLLKCKKELKTDKHLISSYGNNYLGFISKSFGKSKLIELLDMLDKKKQYENFKILHSAREHLLTYNLSKVTLTEKDVAEYMAIAEQASIPMQSWIDAHAKSTLDAIENEPPLVKRGF